MTIWSMDRESLPKLPQGGFLLLGRPENRKSSAVTLSFLHLSSYWTDVPSPETLRDCRSGFGDEGPPPAGTKVGCLPILPEERLLVIGYHFWGGVCYRQGPPLLPTHAFPITDDGADPWWPGRKFWAPWPLLLQLLLVLGVALRAGCLGFLVCTGGCHESPPKRLAGTPRRPIAMGTTQGVLPSSGGGGTPETSSAPLGSRSGDGPTAQRDERGVPWKPC